MTTIIVVGIACFILGGLFGIFMIGICSCCKEEEDPVFNTSGAAIYLNISVESIENMSNEGKLKPFYKQSELDEINDKYRNIHKKHVV